jgi:hypothetical protein
MSNTDRSRKLGNQVVHPQCGAFAVQAIAGRECVTVANDDIMKSCA